MKYKSPSLTVDGIVQIDDKIVLIKRKNPPFKDYWAFPGGFVEYGETTENAVLREIYEETSLKTKIKHLLGVYSDPNRDPRGHTVSVVYVLEPIGGTLKGSDDAKDAKLFKIEEVKDLSLAFDHKKIFDDYVNYLTKNEKKMRK
jgi:8-oxo-dGTP diphosphatase